MTQGGCAAEGSEPFALQVRGDSMAPEFLDGHVIIIDPGMPLTQGVFCVVDYGGEIILGQYVMDGDRLMIQYLKDDLDPVKLTPPFTFKGVVTQRCGRRRKDRKYYDYQNS